MDDIVEWGWASTVEGCFTVGIKREQLMSFNLKNPSQIFDLIL